MTPTDGGRRPTSGWRALQVVAVARGCKDGKDTPLLLHGRSSTFPDGKARFHGRFEYVPPSEETVGGHYDLHLNNGRLLEHFEQGSMTYRSPGIKEITPENFVEVSPELGSRAWPDQTGTLCATCQPAYGRVKVQVLVTDRVKGRQLYMPMNSVAGAGEQADQLAHRSRRRIRPPSRRRRCHMTILEERGREPAAAQKLPLWVRRHPQTGRGD